jgi:glycosyltransferase involved in cell wall biosynthesis
MTMPQSEPHIEPSISVVVPLYNGRAYVEEALRTVAEQTLQPIEVLVIDDGSTDGSDEVVERVVAPFPVKIIRQQNSGQSAARNLGIAQASGEYIAFLDQDDEWRKGHLEQLSQAMDDPDVGWAYSDFDEVDSRGQTVTHSFIVEHNLVHPKRTLAACLGGDLMIIPSASLLRKAALDRVGGFDPDLSGYEDDDLFVRMFRDGWKHAFVTNSLTRFRVHGTSSSSGGQFLASRMTYLDKLIATVGDDDRLNRYWVRDLILPRFFQATLDDYSRVVSRRDWDEAVVIAHAARRLASMMPPRMKRSIEVELMSRPQTCRRALQLLNLLPSRVRSFVNPELRLRPPSRYA